MEYFNKKEREKAKQKNRQEKEERKQERKAASKGKSLEDMMAYVDENGNLSTTPPDPNKRHTINLEDITVGVPKQVEEPPGSNIRNGTVTFFNDQKGFGFITDQKTKERVFVHVNKVNGQIAENTKVTYEVEMGPRGANAVNVTPVV